MESWSVKNKEQSALKALQIDSLKLDDNLKEIDKKTILIKAFLNEKDNIEFDEILNFDTKEKIKNYNNIDSFIESCIKTFKKEVDNNYSVFDISGISQEDETLWKIRCFNDDEYCSYSFK